MTITKTKELVKPAAEIVKINAIDDGNTSWIIIMVSLVVLGIIIVVFCFK